MGLILLTLRIVATEYGLVPFCTRTTGHLKAPGRYIALNKHCLVIVGKVEVAGINVLLCAGIALIWLAAIGRA